MHNLQNVADLGLQYVQFYKALRVVKKKINKVQLGVSRESSFTVTLFHSLLLSLLRPSWASTGQVDTWQRQQSTDEGSDHVLVLVRVKTEPFLTKWRRVQPFFFKTHSHFGEIVGGVSGEKEQWVHFPFFYEAESFSLCWKTWGGEGSYDYIKTFYVLLKKYYFHSDVLWF